MMFSKSVLGTDKKKLKLNWWEYWIGHCWMTGWQNIRGSFRIWSDLMTGKYQDYALMWYDDPYEECYNWFWSCLGDDDTLPMSDRIDKGQEKLVPLNLDEHNNLLDDLLIEDENGKEN